MTLVRYIAVLLIGALLGCEKSAAICPPDDACDLNPSEAQRLIRIIKDQAADKELRRQAFIRFWDAVLTPGRDLVVLSKQFDMTWAFNEDALADVSYSSHTPLDMVRLSWTKSEWDRSVYIVWAPDEIPDAQHRALACFALTEDVPVAAFQKLIQNRTEGELVVVAAVVPADIVLRIAVEASNGSATPVVESIVVWTTGGGEVLTDPLEGPELREGAFFRIKPSELSALLSDVRRNVFAKDPDGVPRFVLRTDHTGDIHPRSLDPIIRAANVALKREK